MADLGPWEPHCGELKVLPPVGLSFKASDHFQGPFFPEGDMAREEMFVPTHGHPWSRCTAWLGLQAGIHGLGLLPGPSCGIFFVHLCICPSIPIPIPAYTYIYVRCVHLYFYTATLATSPAWHMEESFAKSAVLGDGQHLGGTLEDWGCRSGAIQLISQGYLRGRVLTTSGSCFLVMGNSCCSRTCRCVQDHVAVGAMPGR